MCYSWWVKYFSTMFTHTDNSSCFLICIREQQTATRTTDNDLFLSEWAVKIGITSAVFVKIAWLYVKAKKKLHCYFPSLQKQRNKYVHFPNFSPISCCSPAFHFTLCFNLFIDETEEGGRRPLLTTNLWMCVCVCCYTFSEHLYGCRHFPMKI